MVPLRLERDGCQSLSGAQRTVGGKVVDRHTHPSNPRSIWSGGRKIEDLAVPSEAESDLPSLPTSYRHPEELSIKLLCARDISDTNRDAAEGTRSDRQSLRPARFSEPCCRDSAEEFAPADQHSSSRCLNSGIVVHLAKHTEDV